MFIFGDSCDVYHIVYKVIYFSYKYNLYLRIFWLWSTSTEAIIIKYDCQKKKCYFCKGLFEVILFVHSKSKLHFLICWFHQNAESWSCDHCGTNKHWSIITLVLLNIIKASFSQNNTYIVLFTSHWVLCTEFCFCKTVLFYSSFIHKHKHVHKHAHEIVALVYLPIGFSNSVKHCFLVCRSIAK